MATDDKNPENGTEEEDAVPPLLPPDQPQVGKDIFEDGMIPVDEPEPPELIAARIADREAAEAVAAGISDVTDVETNRVLEQLAGSGVSIEDVKEILKSAVTAQNAEISALRQELQQVKRSGGGDGMVTPDGSVGGYPWMFWRLPNKGGFAASGRANWITTGPGGATPKGNRDAGSYSRYLKKGMTPVTKYGYCAPPTRAQAYLDQYQVILQAGGAVEFPVSQVIAYGWHKNPPIAGLKFPQYEQLRSTVKEFQCEACGQDFSFLETDNEVGNSYRAHLMSEHKYPFREAAEAVKIVGLVPTAYRIATVEQMMTSKAPAS